MHRFPCLGPFNHFGRRAQMLVLLCLTVAQAIAPAQDVAESTSATHHAPPKAIAARGVQPGVEVLLDSHAAKLNGKRVALLTNPTGVDRQLRHTIDRVRTIEGIEVVRLFAPEHGLRGGYPAGADVEDQTDPVSGLRIFSLHGSTKKPTAEMLAGLDAVLYDIQDIGSRSYTFVSTLTYLMEACEAAGVEVWVLDRPDPLGGKIVGGPALDEENLSFIGIHNVPQVYGLTPGEWARLIKAERTPKVKLTVVPMRGWRRGMTYGDLGWVWVPPSEHVPRWETSCFYAMTGTIGELSTISIGVGTPLPFEQVGAPWMDGVALAGELTHADIAGVMFRPTTFKPRYGAFNGQFCLGVQIHVTDAAAIDPLAVQTALLRALVRLHPGRKLFAKRKAEDYAMFVKALGDSAIADWLDQGGPFTSIEQKQQRDVQAYLKRREPALIYP